MNDLVGQAKRVAHIVSEWLFGQADVPTHTTPSYDTHSTPSEASYAYVHSEKGDASSSLSSFWNQHQWLNNPSAAFDSFLWNYTPDLHSLQHRYGLDGSSIDRRIIALAALLPLVLLLLIMVFSMGAGYTDENNHPGLQRNRAGSALVGGQKTAKGSLKVGGGSSKKTKGPQAQKKSGRAQDNIGPAVPIEGNTLGSWLAHLGSSGFSGAEKLAYKPINIIAAMKELEKEESLEHSHTDRRNSIGSMMGAMGYAGGEMETHAPYKHLEGKHLGHLLGDTTAPAHESAAGAPEERHANECVSDRAMEEIVGPTVVQHEQDELGLDNQDMEADLDDDEDERLQRQEEEDMVARLIASEESSMAAAKAKRNSEKAKASSKKNVKESRPTYASKVKTHMPGAYVTAQANTAVNHDTPHGLASTTKIPDKKQGPTGHGGAQSAPKPTVSLRKRTPRPDSKQKSVGDASSSSSSALAEGSIGSRIWGYTQSNPFLKNVDSISGGLFGTAVATVATLANTAEAATTLVKDHMPHKVTDLMVDLEDSFENAMETGDFEGLGAGPYGDSWDIKQALNKINQMHDEKESQGGLSLSVEDISVGPKLGHSPQVEKLDAGEESELSDVEQQLNEALMQRIRMPDDERTIGNEDNALEFLENNPQHGHHVSVHPHDEAPSKHPGQQYTIDAQGNKVPVADERRDSGFNMLV
ncbi:hypothetical protein BGZ59_005780 [Podila verticillata]|nr:hypothetical protein BGZ59_005780 [Podila verticillata]